MFSYNESSVKDATVRDLTASFLKILENDENDKLKHLNAGLQTDIDNMSMKINQLEQGARRNTFLISGVSETFAERVTDGGNADNPPQNVREGTIKTVCTVIKEACKIK